MLNLIVILCLFLLPVFSWFFLVLFPVVFLFSLLFTPLAWIWCKKYQGHPLVQLRPLSILIVDDDPSSLAVLGQSLPAQFLNYRLITNSQMGAQAMSRGRYDLIILDNHMPEMSGPEALVCADNLVDDLVKEDQAIDCPIPVIGYSGVNEVNWNLPKLRHFQLVGTLSKATRPSKLKKTLEEICISSKILAA